MFNYILRKKLNRKYKKFNIMQLMNVIGNSTHQLNKNVSFTVSDTSFFFINHKYDHKFNFIYQYNENNVRSLKECYCYVTPTDRQLTFSVDNPELSNDKKNIKLTKQAEIAIKNEIFKYSHLLLNK